MVCIFSVVNLLAPVITKGISSPVYRFGGSSGTYNLVPRNRTFIKKGEDGGCQIRVCFQVKGFI